MPPQVKNSNFIVRARDVIDPDTGKAINTISRCTVKDGGLQGILSSFDVYICGKEKSETRRRSPEAFFFLMLIRLFSFSSSHIQHVFKMRKRKAAFCGP